MCNKKILLNLPSLPKICMFKNVFVLKKLHVIMPNPLKKKMFTLDIRKHLLHNILPIFLLDKIRLALEETKNIHALKIHVDFFPGKWTMEVVTKPDPIYHYLSGYLKRSRCFFFLKFIY